MGGKRRINLRSKQPRRLTLNKAMLFLILLGYCRVIAGQDTLEPVEPVTPVPNSTISPSTPVPTLSGPPDTPSPSNAPVPPTVQPSFQPTIAPSPQPTNAPSSNPTVSLQPTSTVSPSAFPTSTFHPTQVPSISLVPSSPPTIEPTVSRPPSGFPTLTLSDPPTMIPSDLPSSNPTGPNSFGRGVFRQKFEVEDGWLSFNETEKENFISVVVAQTLKFAPVPSTATAIITECTFKGFFFTDDSILQANTTDVDYDCTYQSRATDVSNFQTLYIEYVNANLGQFTTELRAVDLRIVMSLPVNIQQVSSPAPSTSPFPTPTPTIAPTKSPQPTLAPTLQPSRLPTIPRRPTQSPTIDSTFPPTIAPTIQGDDGPPIGVGAIAAIVILFGLGALAGLFFYYLTWKKRQRAAAAATANRPLQNDQGGRRPGQPPDGLWAATEMEGGGRDNRHVVVSPTESLLSNKSMLSVGNSGLGEDSADEYDRTKDLQDEFDQYKDQNLEQFRAGVEGKVTGIEGHMSAAVTKALMGDDNVDVDEIALRWGCGQNCKGIDIEASALYEVSDWLKRNETVSKDIRRAFMQDILNRMVTSVRSGILNAEDGSRTIHESAAILGLELAEELPMTTLIIMGMRKTVSTEEMSKALREFGEVDAAAVASGNRGFGIVRYRRPKSIERAMRRYKNGEIVIQDVEIQMKVLMPSGVVDSRATEKS